MRLKCGARLRGPSFWAVHKPDFSAKSICCTVTLHEPAPYAHYKLMFVNHGPRRACFNSLRVAGVPVAVDTLDSGTVRNQRQN